MPASARACAASGAVCCQSAIDNPVDLGKYRPILSTNWLFILSSDEKTGDLKPEPVSHARAQS